MAENRGKCPPFELVDIMFRNGKVKRGVDPTKWRWKKWNFESDWDIVRYQRNINSKDDWLEQLKDS